MMRFCYVSVPSTMTSGCSWLGLFFSPGLQMKRTYSIFIASSESNKCESVNPFLILQATNVGVFGSYCTTWPKLTDTVSISVKGSEKMVRSLERTFLEEWSHDKEQQNSKYSVISEWTESWWNLQILRLHPRITDNLRWCLYKPKPVNRWARCLPMIEVLEQRDSEQESRKLTFGVLNWLGSCLCHSLALGSWDSHFSSRTQISHGFHDFDDSHPIYKGCCDKITQLCFVNWKTFCIWRCWGLVKMWGGGRKGFFSSDIGNPQDHVLN